MKKVLNYCLLSVLSISLLFLVSCASIYQLKHEVLLEQVETKFNGITADNSKTFENSTLKIDWSTDEERSLGISIKNKTNTPLFINWEESTIVDINDKSHSIAQGETYIYQTDIVGKIGKDKNFKTGEVLKLTTIAPNGNYSNTLSFSDDIKFSEVIFVNGVAIAGGYYSDILPQSIVRTSDLNKELSSIDALFNNKYVKVFLTVKSNEEKQTYMFILKIKTNTKVEKWERKN